MRRSVVYSQADARRIKRIVDEGEKQMAHISDENLIGIAHCIIRFGGVDVERSIKAINNRRYAVAEIISAARPQIFWPSSRRRSAVVGGTR